MSREIKWPHPGEILLKEWLVPMKICQDAKDMATLEANANDGWDG